MCETEQQDTPEVCISMGIATLSEVSAGLYNGSRALDTLIDITSDEDSELPKDQARILLGEYRRQMMTINRLITELEEKYPQCLG